MINNKTPEQWKLDTIEKMANVLADIDVVKGCEHMIPTMMPRYRGMAEAAFNTMIAELPDWHEIHKDEKNKHPLNTMAAIGVTYQQLLAMKEPNYMNTHCTDRKG